MDSQSVINAIGGLLAIIIGWLGRELWDAVQKMKSEMKELEINLPFVKMTWRLDLIKLNLC